MDRSIRKRLSSLQNAFFPSLQSGTAALATFYEEMTGFNEAVSRSAQDLEEETHSLIHDFVQTSNAVIPGLIDLYIASEKINQEQGEEFNKLLNKLSLDDTTYPGNFLILLNMGLSQTRIFCRTRNISSIHSTSTCLAFE